MEKKIKRFYFRYRSSVTGKMVTKWYAKIHPRTTVAERVCLK